MVHKEYRTKEKRRRLKSILGIVLLVLWVIFIFHNSTEAASVSSGRSSMLLLKLKQLLPAGIGRTITEHIVRKLAHFTEFAVEGILLCWCAHSIRGKIKEKTGWLLFAGMATALIDETIQLFSSGRSAQVGDVWIDFSGIVCGCLVWMLIAAIAGFLKK